MPPGQYNRSQQRIAAMADKNNARVPMNFGGFLLHASTAILVVGVTMFPLLEFYSINTMEHDHTLDQDATVQTIAYQIPLATQANFLLSYKTAAHKGDATGEMNSYTSDGDSITVEIGGTEQNNLFTDVTTSTQADGNRVGYDSINAACGDARYDDSTPAVSRQGAVLGSLGLPTLPKQTGAGIPNPIVSKSWDRKTRTLSAIPACHNVNLAAENIGSADSKKLSDKANPDDADDDATLADTAVNLVKSGFRIDGYLLDYNPYATNVEQTLSSRCIVLQPIDQTKALTCSIFLPNSTKNTALTTAINAGKDDGLDGDGNDPYDDKTLLTAKNLQGEGNRAKNCPIICDAQDEDDYFKDRKHGGFGHHVVAVKSAELKECIREIGRAVRETLDTDDITVDQVLSSVTRSETEGDRLSNTWGDSAMYANANLVLMCVLVVLFFFSSFFFIRRGDSSDVRKAKNVAIVILITMLVLGAIVANDIREYDDEDATNVVRVFDQGGSCPDSASSETVVSNHLDAFAIMSAIFPIMLAVPFIGLVFVLPVYFVMYGILSAAGVEYADYYNPMLWVDPAPYSLSLLVGESSAATEKVGMTNFGEGGSFSASFSANF